MIWTWVFLALLVAFVVMMLKRADLAKTAFRYLRSNPRQSAVAVLGLMVSSATIVGSAIVTDSAAAALQQSMERLRGDTDLVMDFRNPVMDTSFTEELDDLDGVTGASWMAMVEIPVNTPTGYVSAEETVYGIQSDYSDAVRWEAVDGRLDGADLVFTETLAKQMAVEVGTTVDLLFPAPNIGQPYWESRFWPNQTSWSMSRAGAVDGGSDPDGLVESFQIQVPEKTTELHVRFSISFQGNSQFQVLWTDPDGQTRTNQTGVMSPAFENRFYGEQLWGGAEAYIPAGNYTVQVSSPDALEAHVQLDWYFIDIAGIPPWEFEAPGPTTMSRTVDAIVLDGADPAGDGAAAFIPYDDFVAAAPDRAGVAHVVVAVEDDMDVGVVASEIAALSQAPERDSHDLQAEEDRAVQRLREEMVQLWGFLAGFTVISAVILIFVLMALLTDERRSTLATVRAIGGQRSVLVRLQLFESLGLAALAGIAGAIVGAIVAFAMARSVDDYWLVDRLVLNPSSIMDAMSIGMMLTLGFAFFASWRSSRIEIAPALRDMDAPARGTRWWDLAIAGLIALTALLIIASTGGSGPVAATLGVPMLMLSGGMIASRWLPKDIVFPAVGLGFLVWMFITRGVIAEVESELEALMLPIRALLYAIGGGLFFAYLGPFHRLLGKAFAWMPGGFHLEQSVAQWRTRPGRAAMTIIMLAMMLMGVMFMASLVNISEREAGSYAGDYDVVTWVQDPLPDVEQWLSDNPAPADIDPFEGVQELIKIRWAPFTITSEMDGGPVYIGTVYSVDASYAASQTHQIQEGGDPDAFDRILADESAIIVDSDLWVGDRLARVGDVIRFMPDPESPDQHLALTVIAVTDGRGFSAVYLHPDSFDYAVGPYAANYVGSAFFADVEEDVDPQQVAARMQTAFHPAGARTEAIDPEPPGIDAVKAVLMLFVFLALAIGAVALGLISARNVVRRRREIGMVRAIGGTRRQVVTSITLETVMLVFIAVIVAWTGTVILIEGLFSDVSYSIDVGRALLLSLYTLALSAIAAIVPAYTAARYDPAVAVRNQE